MGLWEQVVGGVLNHYHLDHQERRKLRELTSLFLHEKVINGAGGLVVDLPMRIYVAAQACLLILNLDLDYFRGWTEVIVYPQSFVVNREERDTAGVVHITRRILGGEAWLRGPVILSWADAGPGANRHGRASNVILHEFAHKLDMLTGSANGMPPLHPNMIRSKWAAAFTRAYSDFCNQVQHHQTLIDPYAATSAAEFFAVLTGVFFEQPSLLKNVYPDVFHQMRLFYQQDPLQRLSRS
jgi:Mlc titration factor MtfA (ptsG expression regulator)